MNYDPPTGPIRVVPPPQYWHPHDPAAGCPPVPTPPRPPTNVAAIVALTAGLLGGLIVPLAIILGPVAIIAGFVGEHQARREGRNLGKVALGGIILGLIVTLALVMRLGARW